jgi:ABC-type sulfate/molybdate transport systems ATPase subunit
LHDQEEALELSQHVVLLNHGRVEQAGAPHELPSDDAPSRADLELGTVDRLARIGGSVKLTVTLPSGDAMSVQVSKLELDRIGIQLGDRVMGFARSSPPISKAPSCI